MDKKMVKCRVVALQSSHNIWFTYSFSGPTITDERHVNKKPDIPDDQV
jgi:hypothetical protein